MKVLSVLCLSAVTIIFAGCASYSWKSSVPEELRSVAVPVFENQTQSTELGSIATQYILREFQREGTFKVKRVGDSSIEVQGAITQVRRLAVAYDRGYGERASEYRLTVEATVSLVDKDNGKVLIENKPYIGETTFLTQNDLLTGQRNASQRIAADLARQIVDDVLSYPYDKESSDAKPVEKQTEVQK